MKNEFPESEKVFLFPFLLKEHCQKTGYQLSEACVFTLLSLAMLTEGTQKKASLLDVHAILKKNKNPLAYPVIKDHLTRVASYGFATKDERDNYRITKKGIRWLETLDQTVEVASCEQYATK
jgi:predicted transcriptional regulator